MQVEQVEKPVVDAKVSAPNIPQSNAKIDSLTGLRFIAASLVFLCHTHSSATLPLFLRTFLSSGYNGVTFFFILSGFVLCYNYHDAFAHRFVPALKSFFVARFARIYPLHFLIFVLFFASQSISDQLEHQFLPILAQLTLTQAWSPDPAVTFSYNSPAWSVSTEAFLYLCLPLLVLLLFKRATKIGHLWLIGGVAFSAIFVLATWFSLRGTPVSSTDLYWLNTLPVPRLGDFLLGCVAARMYVKHTSKPISPREHVLGITLLVLCIAAVILLMGSSNVFLYPYKYDAGYSVFFVFIIYALARYASPLRTFLSTKVLVLLGEASYAFYLLHLLLIYHALAPLTISAQVGQDVFVGMEFLLVVVLALGAYTYVEKPLRKKIRQAVA
jgi:peptidoglycan/LPS O-acetylase OafA/YrhL